ncbi:MAG TPA: ribonuclease D [Alphaproteobacteria bacterium]|nr:ribonuclease D [Alphaproteobacteria bacterium]
MTLLTTTDELARFCAAHAATDFITVDTEFMRERTYWPKLCLIQLGGPTEAVAVDPLAEGISLEPLFELLANPKVVKVFHAARQDVEIFYNLTGKVPAPMFDTQVAGMVCGFGEAASYETLADKLAGAKIDKSSRFTDWAHRPLTEKQLHYALGDVIHLRQIYTKLRDQLEKTGRVEWVKEEMEILTNPNTYKIDPTEIWRRFKWRADKPRLRALLRELAAWRELEAQRLNVPRNRVIRDEALMEIAHHPPGNVHDLARIRGLSVGFAEGKQGKAILDAVAKAMALSNDQCPQGEARRFLPPGLGPVMDLLKVLLKQVSEEHGVAPKLIATTDELEDIAADDDAKVPALTGWRRELFGHLALELKTGDLALSVKGKRVVLTKPARS